MKLAVMQPYFFPYLAYYQLIESVDCFVVFDDVNFIKKGYIHKNSIVLNQNVHPIRLQIEKVSQNKHINEHRINVDPKYLSNLKQTVFQAYRKAPCFDVVFPLFAELIDSITTDNCKLSTFLFDSIKRVASYMGMSAEFKLSSELDYDRSGKGQDKIVSICKLLEATEYVNSVGGKELYDKGLFGANGISLSFLQMDNITYSQNLKPFSPFVSILDLLMNVEQSELRPYNTAYTLV